jgi:hypothetical protein
MRRSLLLPISLVIVLATAAPSARAGTEVGYSRRFGIGVMFGEPSGITGKYWLSAKNALDFGLGFGLGWYGTCDNVGHFCAYHSTSLNADYLWHPSVLARGSVELNWHIGVGGRLWLFNYGSRFVNNRDNTFVDLAARVPIGLDLMFAEANFLEVYGELAPSFYIHDGSLGVEGSLGARFYF